jgi:DNA-binding transcriptional MerR regulator
MPLSRSRDYLSIGEVLDSVREDFPDISISKIRFLEAEGLLSPTRTESGYRKFYEDDVTRLRHILTLQRDHFLPLKVIKERVLNGDPNAASHVPAPLTLVRSAPAETSSDEGAAPAADLTGVQMNRDELCRAARISDQQLRDLEDFGILKAGEGDTYDDADLLVAKAARGFLEHGLEPRHLKMYRQFAEREANLFDQLTNPMTRQRAPGAQAQASQSIREMANLSRQIREGTLRAALREHL